MICGLLTPDGGGGTCLGHDIVRERDAIKRQIGYMTQRFSLYEDLTIAREPGIRRPASTASTGVQRAGRRARSSGSAWRRGAASSPARCRAAGSSGWRWPPASCTSRKLLLLDEPTAGVDPKARRDFWDEIHALAARGHDRAGLDPLHGRGRALPRDRLHRLRQADGARHGRGGHRSSPASITFVGERAGRRPAGARRCATRPGVERRGAVRRDAACLRPRPRGAARGGDRALSRRAADQLERGRAHARGRLHPAHGQGAGQLRRKPDACGSRGFRRRLGAVV